MLKECHWLCRRLVIDQSIGDRLLAWLNRCVLRVHFKPNDVAEMSCKHNRDILTHFKLTWRTCSQTVVHIYQTTCNISIQLKSCLDYEANISPVFTFFQLCLWFLPTPEEISAPLFSLCSLVLGSYNTVQWVFRAFKLNTLHCGSKKQCSWHGYNILFYSVIGIFESTTGYTQIKWCKITVV